MWYYQQSYHKASNLLNVWTICVITECRMEWFTLSDVLHLTSRLLLVNNFDLVAMKTSLYRDSIHCTKHEITPMPYPFVLVTFTRTFIRKTLSFVTFPFKHSHDWDTYSSVIVCRQGHQCSLMYLMTELPDWEVDASYANHPWLAANIHRCSISHDRALVSRLALISGKASMLSACLFGGSPNSSWYIQLVL